MPSTPQDSSTSNQTLSPDDMRARPRYYPDPQATRVQLEREGSAVVAMLVDESFDGIGVLCREPVSYDVGELLQVLYRGARLRAEVKYRYLTDESQCRVGLVWEKFWKSH